MTTNDLIKSVEFMVKFNRTFKFACAFVAGELEAQGTHRFNSQLWHALKRERESGKAEINPRRFCALAFLRAAGLLASVKDAEANKSRRERYDFIAELTWNNYKSCF